MCQATRWQSKRLPSARGLAYRLALVAVGLVGVLMAHHPMLLTRMARIQGSDDPRLINYLLEHSYLWVKQAPHHQRFWDIPFFYPTRNTAGLSDTLLTIAPIYWGWRTTGLRPDTAYQLWMLTISALNYLAGYWLLRTGFRRGVLGSIAGAYLFAFAAPRLNQIEHPQLAPQIYTVATLMALIRVFRDRADAAEPWKAFAPWSAAGLSLAAQFYTSFYLGWFLVLALVLSGTFGLILPQYHPHLIRVVRGQWKAIGIAAALSTLAVKPLLEHYIQAMSEVGFRNYHIAVYQSIPDWRACVYLGPDSWVWGWMSRLALFRGLGMEHEMRCGLGLVTPLAGLAGLLTCRRLPAVRLIGLTMLGVLLTVMRFDRQIVEGVALGVWMTCALGLYRGVRSRAELWVPGVTVIVLTVTIFPGMVLAAPLVLVVLLLAMSQLPPGHVRDAARLLILVTLIVFPPVASHSHRPVALRVAAVVAALCAISGGCARPSRILRWLVAGGSVACIALWLSPGEFNLWPYVSAAIPGGRALRVVSRGLLLGLIPAALGLACLLDTAVKRRMHKGLICALGLACLLDQGVTVPSFDKMKQRADVAALARRIDRRCKAFYYSPRYTGLHINPYHLDAMWAEIETGVPTVNGYSGATPVGWLPLLYGSVETSTDEDRIGQALAAWASLHRMNPDDIWWVTAGAGLAPGDARE